MTYYKVIIWTQTHPGYVEYYFYAPEFPYRKTYQTINPEPDRGQAWESPKRIIHAKWKREFLEWFRTQPNVIEIQFKVF